MFVKHVCPPKHKCHCDIDLWPRNPKFNRGYLLVTTNHHTKLESPWAHNEFSSYWSDKVCLRTDTPTIRRTDQSTCAKQYTPTSSNGGKINSMISITVREVRSGNLSRRICENQVCNKQNIKLCKSISYKTFRNKS